MRVSLEEKIDKIMDDRNYEITNELNDVLNNVKGNVESETRQNVGTL